MTEVLNKATVKMGWIVPVKNLKKGRLEAEEYLALKVEDENGKNERWLLFTGNELKSGTEFYFGSLEVKVGRLYPVKIGRRSATLVKVCFAKDDSRTFLLSAGKIKVGETRAEKNPEDIPHMSKLQDLLD